MTAFGNFGFENDTINGWTKGGGIWNGGQAPVASDYLPGGSRSDIADAEVSVTSAQTDARTDNKLKTVYDGAHSVMINSAQADQSVSVISQQALGYSGSSISFAYAAVLQKSHETGEADGFSIVLTDTTTGKTLYEVAYDSSTVNKSFSLSSSGWYYEDWQKVTIDTRAYTGHDLTLSILAYDCSLGGHGGTVYFDGFNVQTGKISGNLFHDYDANGVAGAREPDLAGWTVYVDANLNGARDAGEASAVTDAHGRYVLAAVPLGTAEVRVDVPTGTWEAWMAQTASVTVTDGATTSGVDLAVTGGATPFDDRLEGVKSANETIDGLSGNDLVLGREGDDAITGGAGDDILRGNRGADVVGGGIGDDILRGANGDDRLDGGAGDDAVTGGAGDDVVTGGAGADVLAGRSGADTFVFSDAFGEDVVLDFRDDQGDKIALAVAGVQGLSDLVLTQQGTSTVVTLASGADDQITLRHVLASTLTADDFIFAPPPAAFGDVASASTWHGGPFHPAGAEFAVLA